MKSSKKELSERELLKQVVDKLDMLILVSSLQGRSKEEQIKQLASLGYSNSQMGAMLAIPKGTVDFIRAGIGKGTRSK